MAALLPDVDPDGLLEFSVVFTDRSLNHMSQSFQGVMRDISTLLKGFTMRITSLWSPVAGPMRWRRSRGNW